MTVTYVYGDELGPYSGRIRKGEELPAMAFQFGAFSVYVVEVCQRLPLELPADHLRPRRRRAAACSAHAA